MGQTFLVRHNCINIETYLYISETTFNCDKFVTDRDNNIYKSDNFYLYNFSHFCQRALTNLSNVYISHLFFHIFKY